jgi:hypothetical protein
MEAPIEALVKECQSPTAEAPVQEFQCLNTNYLYGKELAQAGFVVNSTLGRRSTRKHVVLVLPTADNGVRFVGAFQKQDSEVLVLYI